MTTNVITNYFSDIFKTNKEELKMVFADRWFRYNSQYQFPRHSRINLEAVNTGDTKITVKDILLVIGGKRVSVLENELAKIKNSTLNGNESLKFSLDRDNVYKVIDEANPNMFSKVSFEIITERGNIFTSRSFNKKQYIG